MLLCDVNVLVHAHRLDATAHAECAKLVRGLMESDGAFGVSDLVFSGFLRIVTHPGIFKKPSPLASALDFVADVRLRPNAVPVSPGDRHWDIFTDLCRASEARGNLIPDAYLAALAIESGCEWVTTDRDYARFPGLSWRAPA
jgi:toxin-antitoxin system PIN domain toxin